MIVYKYFIKTALKQKLIILGYTLVFLVLAIMFGGSTEEMQGQFVPTKLKVGIVDKSGSDLSKGLIAYLGEKNHTMAIKDDEDYIKEQVFLQVVDGVVVIPKDFDERVMGQKEALSLYKDDRKISASYLEQQTEKYLVFANAMYNNGQLDLKQLDLALKEEVGVQVLSDDGMAQSTSDNNWFTSYYNFTSYIIIAVYVAIIGLVMMEFRDEKIENRIKVSSKKYFHYNKEIYLGQITLGAIITLVFILGSVVIKGQYIREVNFGKYVINIMVFSFAIQCFAFLVSQLTTNRLVINGVSTVVSLGVSFISGVMVTQELLGEKVLAIAKFFPTYYFVTVNEKTIQSLGDIRYELLMQVMFGIVFLLLGYSRRNV